MKKHIIVIGGGMAGTAAAYELRSNGYSVTIVEKTDRLGGRIRSVVDGKASFELGAGFVTDVYSNIFSFLDKHDLRNRLMTRQSQTSITRGGRAYLLTASNILLKGKPFSRRATLALLREAPRILVALRKFDVHEIWRSQSVEPRPLSSALRGKHRQEAIEYFWQPIVEAYCYWSAKNTSEAAMLWIVKIIRGQTYAMRGGLQQIPERTAKGNKVMLLHEVVAVEPRQSDFFSSVSYSATALVARTFKLGDSHPPNQALGYARAEGGPLSAVTITTELGQTVVKSYANGVTGPHLCRQTDVTIRSTLLDATPDSAKFGKPAHEVIQRWPEAIPEFSIEHVKYLARIAQGELSIDGDCLTFAGDYLDGAFIEGAHTSGIKAAERLMQQL